MQPLLSERLLLHEWRVNKPLHAVLGIFVGVKKSDRDEQAVLSKVRICQINVFYVQVQSENSTEFSVLFLYWTSLLVLNICGPFLLMVMATDQKILIQIYWLIC